MSLKGKYSKRLGKSSNGPSKLNESNAGGTSVMPPELEQQFEAELCWCIQQLQIALKSGKLNNKQVQDHTRALNILMNNSAPIIKKRQVMRLSFGDYRAKMTAETKKCSRNDLNMRVKPGAPSKKSLFVKKSAFASSSGSMFQFNFKPPSPSNDELSNGIQNVNIDSRNQKELTFIPSDNSFRFSFDINVES